MSQFQRERQVFFEEMQAYYRKGPADISQMEAVLDQKLAENPQAHPFTKKTWIYEVAAEHADVHLFRHCPFYFAFATGREQNSVQSAFPPKPGLDSWLMRRDSTGFLEEFQGWVGPYMEQDIIDSTMYIDCAHHAMGLDIVLEHGFSGLRALALEALEQQGDPEKRIFLQSVVSAMESCTKLTGRFAHRAEAMLEGERDPAVRKRLERIASSARRCPGNPPETFFEALNTVWYLRELGNSLEALGFAILGHLDRSLLPYYERDIATGILTREEAQDLVNWFCCLTDARWDLDDTPYGTNTTINIGGCDRDGMPVFNDITRFVINCYRAEKLVNPKLQARFSPGAPEEYFQMIGELAATGTNVLSVFNDEILIEAHRRMGKELEDCRLYVSGGCQEPVLANTELNSRAFCYLNPSLYLLMMLFPEKWDFFQKEGIAPVSLRGSRDFDECYRRVFQNLRMMVNAITFRYNGFESRWAGYNPCPLFSATIQGCIESGRDVSQGGARYNGNAYALSGIGTFIDSLYAIREVVFREKKLGWDELRDLLAGNFEGNPRMMYYLRNKVDKYGRDSGEVNAFAARVLEDVADATSWMPNTRGGVYEASLWSYYGYQWLKEGTGATPDGRRAGEPLSRGINPAESTSTSLTAMIHSLKQADLNRFAGSAVLYLEMPLSLGEQGGGLFTDLIHYFIDCGGNTFDFDVVDPDRLRDALEHPEDHRNLVVRVCGYSARFVTLPPEMQREIAARALRLVGG